MMTQEGEEPALQVAAADTPGENIIVPLHAEELAVSRRQVERAVVRVATLTHEVETLVEEDLVHQRAEIRHVPIGRVVDAFPDIRQEGEFTIIPVVEEIVVVERRLLLKEEVHVRRVRTTDKHSETVLLRQQEAVVTRMPVDDADAAHGSNPDRTEVNSQAKDE